MLRRGNGHELARPLSYTNNSVNFNRRLLTAAKIAEIPLKDLVRETMPVLVVMVGALALTTLIPELVLFLPRKFGYQGSGGR